MASGLQSKRNLLIHIAFWCLLSALPVQPAWAAIISKTITIDGNMSDWSSILANAGQVSTDAQDLCPNSQDRDSWSGGDIGVGSCVGLSGGTGRDLEKFAFTYDQNNIYLYVQRFASSTNVTDWWFYIDTNNDGLMESTDLLYHVRWQGSNQTTDREIWTYTPANAGGDPLTHLVKGPLNTADGYDMPGTVSNRQILSSANGGATDGVEMETYIPWSTICGIGCGPQSVRFHIASSNGTNLPSSLVDNMDGPSGGGSSGGAIVILDLGVNVAASVSQAIGASGTPFTYTVTVTNNGGGDATGVSVTNHLPADVTYVSDDSGGSYNPSTGVWTIGSLANGTAKTLHISVTPNYVTANTVDTDTVDSLTLNESDTNANNNAASVNVTISPSPDLSITKTHSGDFTVGLNDSWTLDVSNAGPGVHTGTLTVTDPLPTGLSYVSATGTNWTCGASGQTVTCTYSQDLAVGASTPPITLTVTVGGGVSNPFTNTATVTAASYENNTSNNSASDTVNVQSGGTLECYATANDSAGTLNLFRVDTGNYSVVNQVATSPATGITHIAYNCATGTLYGVRNGNQFGTIDPNTGAFTDIGTGMNIGTTVTGLAYDPTTGGVFGVRSTSGGTKRALFQIDVATGSVVPNAFGVGTDFLQLGPSSPLDLAFNAMNGTLTLIDDNATSGKDQLVTIDRTTGSGTNLPNSLTPVNNMIGLSSDDSGTGSSIGATSANRIYFIDSTGAVGANGAVSGISAFQGFDCIYGCTPKLLDIQVNQTASNTTPYAGDTVTLAVTVTNAGPSDATALQLNDVIPAGFTFGTYTSTAGSYDNTTGLWYIGALASGASATLTITVTASGAVGTTASDTASVAYVTQTDTNTGNDAGTVKLTIVQSDLSTSTMTVTDVNGGQPNPGDILRYTVTLNETAGVQATGVSVTDNLPPYTSNLTLVTMPGGATNNSGATYPLEIDNITVPAGGAVTIVFDVTIDASATSGDIVTNTSTLTNATGVPNPGSLASPDVNVVKSAQVKQLYLGPAAGETVNGIAFPAYALGRLPFTSTTGVTIAGAGGSQTWTLSPALVAQLIIDGTSSPGGVSVPIQLVLSRGSSGPDRTAQASLGYEANCTGSPSVIGTTANTTVLSGNNGPLVTTLSFNLAGDVTVSSGDCLTLTVTNNTASASRSFTVSPAGAGSTSEVDLGVYTFIKVENVAFYAAAGGTGTPLTQVEYGNPVYIRSTVSDPFGTYDINNTSLEFRDAAGTLVYSASPMTQVSSAGSTETFENGPITINTPYTPGVWNASVIAMEGTEGLVQDEHVASIEAIAPPNLTVTKTASTATATSGDLITYTIVVTNSGPGEAINVNLQTSLNAFSSLNVTYGGSSPFQFIDDPTTPSNLTVGTTVYSSDHGATYSHTLPASGFDSAVTDWKMTMNGTMAKNGKFTVKYQMQLR